MNSRCVSAAVVASHHKGAGTAGGTALPEALCWSGAALPHTGAQHVQHGKPPVNATVGNDWEQCKACLAIMCEGMSWS